MTKPFWCPKCPYRIGHSGVEEVMQQQQRIMKHFRCYFLGYWINTSPPIENRKYSLWSFLTTVGTKQQAFYFCQWARSTFFMFLIDKSTINQQKKTTTCMKVFRFLSWSMFFYAFVIEHKKLMSYFLSSYSSWRSVKISKSQKTFFFSSNTTKTTFF